MDVTNEQVKAALARNPSPTVRRLFHYSNRIDFESLVRQICAQIFYFSNPSGFNDASDFRPHITRNHDGETVNVPVFTSMNEGGVKKTELPLVEKADPTFTTDFIRCKTLLRSDAAKSYRVLCLTESDALPLMWAHYGGRSCGVAYGFDVETLEKIRVPHKVEYVNSLSLTESMAPAFTWEAPLEWRTKEKVWSCEREWRLFTQNSNNSEAANYVSLQGSLRSITLGLSTERNGDVHDRVVAIISQLAPEIELFQVERHAGVWTTTRLAE